MADAFSNPKPEVEDSASAPPSTGKSGQQRGTQQPRQGGNNPKNPPGPSNTRTPRTKAKGTNSQATGFSEGNAALLSYGLSVSGRKERILSPFKADKFFHFVDQSYRALVDSKPHVSDRFSLAEFRHASALQLYQRLEACKFDALGIKPAAPVRIPLPRNTRVFQPLWSVLANIGIVNDDDLRVTYIPDGILPKTEDLTDPEDIENLIACTLYDWHSSWNNVLAARKSKKAFEVRDGFTQAITSNESNGATRQTIIADIATKRGKKATLEASIYSGKYIYADDGTLRTPMYKKDKDGKDTEELDQDAMKKGTSWKTPAEFDDDLNDLYQKARDLKARKITPTFDVSYKIDSYKVSDGEILANPGAYGARLHWDPQLWLDYDRFVEELNSVAMFSLSMPVETTGTYAWLLPVENRPGEADVFCKLPKASIPPVTWILALLLQSSTLADHQRSTFYTETDRLGNVLGLRERYIRSAIKRAAPVEQYGTY